MGAVLWGCLSALCLGCADFMARQGTRSLGALSVYLFVLSTGGIVLTLFVAVSGSPLVWSAPGFGLAAVHGVAVAVMSVLLYTALARGPVSMVAPVVAAHPVLVLAFAVATGTRPDLLQWLAMAAIIVGVVSVARRARPAPADAAADPSGRAVTLAIAAGACLAYALIIISGQAALPYLGELQTTWMGRLVGLAVLMGVFAVRRERPRWSRSWLPCLVVLGLLDAGGYLALFAGSTGAHPEAAAVAASTFGVVTVVLARTILAEPVTGRQWRSIALVFGGVAALAGSGG